MKSVFRVVRAIQAIQKAYPVGVRPPPLSYTRSKQAATYSGPPTYETIAGRSKYHSYTNLVREEGDNRGGTEDAGPIDPNDYGVVISGITDAKLRTDIAEVVGIKYLTRASQEEADKVIDVGDCYIFGPKSRLIFPAVVSLEGNHHWIFFLLDTGIPLSYLSFEVSVVVFLLPEGLSLILAGLQTFRD